jgi:hypothetical protein
MYDSTVLNEREVEFSLFCDRISKLQTCGLLMISRHPTTPRTNLNVGKVAEMGRLSDQKIEEMNMNREIVRGDFFL